MRRDRDQLQASLSVTTSELTRTSHTLAELEDAYARIDSALTAALSEIDAKRIVISDLETRLMTQSARGDDFERALGERHSELSDERKRLATLAKSFDVGTGARSHPGAAYSRNRSGARRQGHRNFDAHVETGQRKSGSSRAGSSKLSEFFGRERGTASAHQGSGRPDSRAGQAAATLPSEADTKSNPGVSNNNPKNAGKSYRKRKPLGLTILLRIELSDCAHPGSPAAGITGVVPGSGTGAGTRHIGCRIDRWTNHAVALLQLVTQGRARIRRIFGLNFSAGTSFGAGMLGACCGKTGVWAASRCQWRTWRFQRQESIRFMNPLLSRRNGSHSHGFRRSYSAACGFCARHLQVHMTQSLCDWTGLAVTDRASIDGHDRQHEIRCAG